MPTLPRRLILALLLILFVAWPVCAEEAIDPYRFFAAHYEAMGGLERFKQIHSGWSVGTVRYDGLEGTFEGWSEKPLRYRLDEDFGIIRQSEGDDGTRRWRRDTNGQVEEVRDEETLKRRRIAELLENFEHLNPDSPWFTLSDAGLAEVEGVPCRVLRLENRINSDVSRFFFALDNLRVVKTVDTEPDVEVHTRYHDYRRIDGLRLPFRQVADIHGKSPSPPSASIQPWTGGASPNPRRQRAPSAFPPTTGPKISPFTSAKISSTCRSPLMTTPAGGFSTAAPPCR